MVGIIISNIQKFFIPLGLFVWGLFMPRAAGYTYIAIYGLFEGYLFLIDKMKPNPDPEKWSAEEIKLIKKYHLALRFSFGAKDMSVYLNGFRWASILWVILFLFNQMWLPALFLVVSFFITASISVRLDPIFFLSDAVSRGQMQFTTELNLLQQVIEKMHSEKSP